MKSAKIDLSPTITFSKKFDTILKQEIKRGVKSIKLTKELLLINDFTYFI